MSTATNTADRWFARPLVASAWPLRLVLAGGLVASSMIVTTFDFVKAQEGADFGVDFQTLFRLGACSAFGLYGVLHLPVTLREYFRFPGAWATIILAWAVVTVPLSISPVYSLAAVFALACVTLFVPAALSQLGGLKMVNALLVGLLCFVGLNWFFHFTVPKLAQSPFVMPDGETIYRFGNDAQQLGLQIAWSLGLLLLLAFRGYRSWPVTALLVLPLIGTLPLTQSRTATLTCMAVSGVVVWMHISYGKRLLALSAGFCLLAITIFMASSGFDFSGKFESVAGRISRSGQIAELKNFTGRAEIWQYVARRSMEAPALGFGYGASRFALQEDQNYPLSFPADHAHNLYLNTALTMGLPGLLILVAMLFHMLLRNLLRPSAMVSIALAFVVVASITEVIFFGPMPRSHAVIWLIALFWQQMGMDADIRGAHAQEAAT